MEINDLINKIEQDITSKVESAMQRKAVEVMSYARAFAPEDTGALKGSFTYKISSGVNLIVATIGTNLPYSTLVEFGSGIYNGSSSTGWWWKTENSASKYYPDWHFTYGQRPQLYMFKAYKEALKGGLKL